MSATAPLAAFVSRFGSAAASTAPVGVRLDALPPDFPRPVLELWRLHGFGTYDNGLIWTHPPPDFDGVIEEWTGLGSKESALIARFSFGDFAMWARGRVFFVSVHTGHVQEVPGIDFLFDEMFCDDEFLDNFAGRPLHKQCTRSLGAILADECFAFVPALALGGNKSADTVRKALLLEHLALLAQINGPVNLF